MTQQRSRTFTLCDGIRRNILLRASETIQYNSWSDEFCRKQMLGMVDMLKSREYDNIDPTLLSYQEMDDLGFGRWNGNSPMRLIPLWLLPFLIDQFFCADISGKMCMRKKTDIDNDHRGGMLAYGVFSKEEA